MTKNSRNFFMFFRNHQRCSLKECVLKNFSNFTVNFAKFLRTAILKNNSDRPVQFLAVKQKDNGFSQLKLVKTKNFRHDYNTLVLTFYFE